MPNIPDAIDQVLAHSLTTNGGNRITDELIVGIRSTVGAAFASLLAPVNHRAPLAAPSDYHEYRFLHVYMNECLPMLRAMHEQHWEETEGYRHDLPFQPNYDGMMALEDIGQFMQFVIAYGPTGQPVGNGACYVQPCYHTGQLVATEDTWFIAPEHRKGLLAAKFLQYMEKAAAARGAKEVRVSVKTVNKVNVLLERMGYVHAATQYSKILGGE